MGEVAEVREELRRRAAGAAAMAAAKRTEVEAALAQVRGKVRRHVAVTSRSLEQKQQLRINLRMVSVSLFVALGT
jgi:hypothetical protein